MARKRWIVGTAIAAVVVVAAGVFGLWWFLWRDDAPPPASIEEAVAGVTDTTSSADQSGADAPTSAATTTTEAGSDEATASAADVSGTWTVDTETGSFEDFTSSWVGYRIEEELDPIGGNTAVGRTPAVSGEITIDGSTITEVEIDADLTQLESDNGTRDDQLRGRGLETDTFPNATFSLTEPIELGAVPEPGSPISVDATGELTLHGVTEAATVALEAQLVDDLVVVAGSTDVALADYDIDPPTGFRVLSVADTGTIELQLIFTRI